MAKVEVKVYKGGSRGCRRAAWVLLAMAWVAAGQERYAVSREPAGAAGSPEVIVIRDNEAGVEAAVAPSQGGELTSLRVRFHGGWIELLYRGRDYGTTSGFRGKASFLWPAVGAQYAVGTVPESSCGDGSFAVGDRRFPMPCHGFVKEMPWKESESSADGRGARVTVELRDSAETRKFYPFGFVVRATLRDFGRQALGGIRVSAARGNGGAMPFAIGNHVAFRVPFVEGTDAAAMLFETPNGRNCCAIRTAW